jgi:biotin carboxylase
MRLLIGNSTNVDLVGPFEKAAAAWWAQRLVFFARDGDVLVLPTRPEPAFVDYVAALTGTDPVSLRFVVPPAGFEGTDRLTPDRLRDRGFRDELAAAVAGRPIETVRALWPDTSIVALAAALGAEHAVPGGAFAGQGGGALVNSKAVFRALAAAAGVPLAPGTVCSNRTDTEDAILGHVGDGHPAIVKHEFYSGGVGNRIVSPVGGVRALGAPTVTVATDRAAVRAFLDEQWQWLAGAGHRVIVERYFPDSAAVFAEFDITDGGVEFGAHGEMIMAPVASAQVIPAQSVKPDALGEVVEGGRRLCEPLHAMGYRGRLSADAVVTPAGEVYFTEYNGRVTGSTHIYAVIGEQIVGPDYAADRVILERVGWPVPSFAAAAGSLAAAGIAYDPDSRTGVVLNTSFDERTGHVWYCVVAESIDAALDRETVLKTLF